jgi:hypothetical protein
VGNDIEGFLGGLSGTIESPGVSAEEGMQEKHSLRRRAIGNNQRKNGANVGVQIKPNAKQMGPRVNESGGATENNQSWAMSIAVKFEWFVEW